MDTYRITFDHLQQFLSLICEIKFKNKISRKRKVQTHFLIQFINTEIEYFILSFRIVQASL